jgi:hypothetical protein
MPLTAAELVRGTAEGMIRNFGTKAAEEADHIAARHALTSVEGKALWLAVAQQIRTTSARSRN